MDNAAVMPFQSAPRGPDAASATARVTAADAALRAHDEARRTLVAERAAAIADARKEKVTLKDLAELLGVSPERIRQMEAGR